MEPWTESRVRQLLEAACQHGTARGGYLLGAQLGNLLQRLDPDFRPTVLGDEKLTELLRRFPEVVTVEARSGTDPVIRFRSSSPPKASSEGLASVGDERLDQPLWLALVSDRPELKWFLDLETLAIVEVHLDVDGTLPGDSEVAQTADRFLEIPPIPQDILRTLAREFVRELERPDLVDDLHHMIEGDRWYPRFSKALTASGLPDWRDTHRRFVVEQAREWLTQQGIRPDRFIRRISSAARARGIPNQILQAGLQPGNIREVVMRAIARMSDEELLDLKIPLRYLV